MSYKTKLIYSADDTDMILSDLSVKIHGAIMGLIPSSYAEQLHKGALQPFSLHAAASDGRITLHLCTLCDSADIIADALCEADELPIYGMPQPIRLISYQRDQTPPPEQLAAMCKGNRFRLELLSPAVIKKGGKPFCTLNIGRYFRSVADKLQEFNGIELDTEKLCSDISSVDLTELKLSTTSHNVSGTRYTGILGHADIRFNNDISHEMSMLLAYAQYSGIGAKTALGMGAFRIHNV